MAVSPHAFLKAAYPPPLSMPDIPMPETSAPSGFRRFILRWNSCKEKNSRRRSDEWQECQGVLFSAGDLVRVALSNGMHFVTQEEMEQLLARGGDYKLTWLDN